MSRISLVTGGSRGIGFAIAAAMLKQGDTVAITATTEAGAEKAASELRGAGVADERVVPLVCDVRDPYAVEAAVADVVERCGGLDVLINNAGVGTGSPVAEMSYDEWDRIIETNVTGVFNCCKAVLPHLKSRGGGWIINISSLASKNAFAGGAAYCASKSALNAFSEALMQEVRHDNIRVSYVLPGSVATEFSGRAIDAGADWRLQADDVAQVVMDLLAHPDRSLPSRVEIRPSRPPKK